MQKAIREIDNKEREKHMKSIDKTEEWQQGHNAALCDIALKDCPYDAKTFSASRWKAGWCHASYKIKEHNAKRT